LITRSVSRPKTHRHNIWEIIEHVSFWLDMTGQVMEGRRHPGIGELDDWPTLGSTPEDYVNSVATLSLRLNALVDTVESFDKGFDEKIAPDDFTYGWMLNGVCNHNLYHAGQIILLRTSNP
jgi:hypothetical protein